MEKYLMGGLGRKQTCLKKVCVCQGGGAGGYDWGEISEEVKLRKWFLLSLGLNLSGS